MNLSYDNLLDTIRQLHEDKQTNHFITNKQNLVDRINLYLQHGGFFNPEHMDHDQVRNLLLDIKDYLENNNRVANEI